MSARALPLLVSLLALGAGCGGSSAEEVASEAGVAPARARVEPDADAPLVLFLGDSITAGLHLDPTEAFPARLADALAAEGRPIRIVDAGVSGDTTAGGLRRIEWVLQREPDVLVLELGGNDGLRGIELASVESNLDAIVERAKERGVRVLLLGMRLPPSYGDAYAEGFAAVYERVAERHAVALVPYFMDGVGGVPELNLDDQLHPNAKGHERLAENVLPALRAVLDEVAAR